MYHSIGATWLKLCLLEVIRAHETSRPIYIGPALEDYREFNLHSGYEDVGWATWIDIHLRAPRCQDPSVCSPPVGDLRLMCRCAIIEPLNSHDKAAGANE